MARLYFERQKALEPIRMAYAMQKITEKGYNPIRVSDTEINFMMGNCKIHYFPYSGWHSGRGISKGRGLNRLLNQI